MNRQIGLRPVRRPEARAGNVRQCLVVGRRYLRNSVNGLCTIAVAKYAAAAEKKAGIFLQIVRPIGCIDSISRAAVGFDGILVDRGVDHTEIVEDSAGLGTFTGTEEAGHRDRGQERDDRHNDHNFHEGEAPAAFVKFVQHC
jgi:hypothetical protein